MRKLMLLAVMFLLGFGSLTYAMSLDDALALFSGSDIMIQYSDEGRATLEEMIDAFRGALGVTADLDETDEDAVMAVEVDSEKLDIVNKLSQAYYTYADVFLDGDPNERATYLKGKHWGLKALRMDPVFAATESSDGFVAAVATSENLPGLYWTSANWMRAGEFNVLEAVFAGVPEKTDVLTRRCIELDDSYLAYGAYRALGAFWAGLKKLPAGYYRKNWSRSLGYFCHVVDEPEICADVDCDVCPDPTEFDPAADEYFENRLLFVQYYLMQRGMWEDAKRILDQVLSEPIGDKYPLYNAFSQEKARGFLEEVEEHL